MLGLLGEGAKCRGEEENREERESLHYRHQGTLWKHKCHGDLG